LNDGEEGTLVIAEEQTVGKGRQGRTWISEKGKNLTFSVVVKPNNFQEVSGLLPLCAGLAVVEAIQSCTAINAECKWPNDVLIDNKKVCGILCESSKTGIIIGIGINVNQSSFAEELKSQATSLLIEQKKEIDRIGLLVQILERLEHWYKKVIEKHTQEILSTWKAHSTMLGRQVRVLQNNQTISGIAIDLVNDGGLLLQTNDTITKVHSGDVHVIH
jgi:BirA family biotin operon repressor/biotin-[acetyl-CoA-carboxylase] ligase